MSRTNQLFGIGPFLTFKAGIEAIRLLVKNATFSRNRPLTAFDIA